MVEFSAVYLVRHLVASAIVLALAASSEASAPLNRAETRVGCARMMLAERVSPALLCSTPRVAGEWLARSEADPAEETEPCVCQISIGTCSLLCLSPERALVRAWLLDDRPPLRLLRLRF